jgi:hypothetical protein
VGRQLAHQPPLEAAILGEKDHILGLGQQRADGRRGQTHIAKDHYLADLAQRRGQQRFAVLFHLQALVGDAQLRALVDYVDWIHKGYCLSGQG